MDNAPRARRTRAPAGLAAILLALSAGAAFAGNDSASFGVGLRITASCEVDSMAVVEPAARPSAPLPQVRCALPTPRVVRVTQEPAPLAAPGPAAAPANVRVVTLVF